VKREAQAKAVKQERGKRVKITERMRENMEKIKNFRDLKVWQSGKEIALKVYALSSRFPKEEAYGISSQMRRAAVAIPSNIAEGFNRYHNKEYRQFLYVALGSCAELETQIEICSNLGYLMSTDKDSVLEQLDHISAMMRNLIKKL